MPGRVELVENLGSERIVHARIEGVEAILTSSGAADPGLARGSPCEVVFDSERLIFFDGQGRNVT
jgi:ABC-type sugar transport system ATPase subunit